MAFYYYYLVVYLIFILFSHTLFTDALLSLLLLSTLSCNKAITIII